MVHTRLLRISAEWLNTDFGSTTDTNQQLRHILNMPVYYTSDI